MYHTLGMIIWRLLYLDLTSMVLLTKKATSHLKHFHCYSYEFYSNSLFTMSSPKAFNSKVALCFGKCESFHKQAIFA